MSRTSQHNAQGSSVLFYHKLKQNSCSQLTTQKQSLVIPDPLNSCLSTNRLPKTWLVSKSITAKSVSMATQASKTTRPRESIEASWQVLETRSGGRIWLAHTFQCSFLVLARETLSSTKSFTGLHRLRMV